MPPGPAALVKPVPCCVPRLQPCCPAKEVISQQRQVTLSFFFFFFLFFFLFFFSPSPSHPHPPLRSSVLPAPQAVRSTQQTCLHNTTHLHQEERKIKKKKKKGKPNPPNCSQTGSLQAPVPPGASSPPRQPCGERLGLPAWDEMAEAGSTAIRARRGAVLGLAGWLLVFYFLF